MQHGFTAFLPPTVGRFFLLPIISAILPHTDTYTDTHTHTPFLPEGLVVPGGVGESVVEEGAEDVYLLMALLRHTSVPQVPGVR